MGDPDADLIVLDLDGTLIDLPVDWGALRAELRAELEAHGVVTRASGVFGILEELQRRGETAAFAACSDRVGAAEEAAGPAGRLNAALVRWLPLGTPVAFLSLNSGRAVEAALRGVELPGDVVQVAGREDVPAAKPDPAGLLRILAAQGVPADRAVMVGDSPGDLECADAAGVRGIDVEEIGVDWVARD